jgi:uncharacterized protein
MARIIDFLLPKEEKFYEMLLVQTEIGTQAAKELDKLVHSYNSMSAMERQIRINKIRELEHKGDTQTHAIMDKLHSSFITPIDREDIHELAVLLDDQIDYIDNVGKKLTVFRVAKLPAVFIRQIEVCVKSVYMVHEVVQLFQHHHTAKKNLVKIHDLEEEADHVFAEAVHDLFKEGANPIDVIKFKDIFETAERIPDNSQAVAVLIDGIVVKNA